MTLRLLAVGAQAAAAAKAAGLAATQATDTRDAAAHDAVLYVAHDRAALQALGADPELPRIAQDLAVVVVAPEHDPAYAAYEAALLKAGVQAMVPTGDATALARTLRQAVVLKQRERSLRVAYATDLATGLPHESQLLEHMAQLLALREREPAPMALVVLQIEGIAAAGARLGDEAANVLRRKVAVRLRGGLRASDVVASIGPDQFAVLLGHLEAAGDSERVAAKLVRALQQPFVVAGQPCTLGAALGLALSPQHGNDAKRLLRRARAQASGTGTLGDSEEGFTQPAPLDDRPAANDDDAG
jgi:diguanylate cyclase (GGDEF)-like protein